MIPKDVWEWDEHARVYMRFGVHELGNWKYDFGPGKIERYYYLKLQVYNIFLLIESYQMDL